MFKRIIKRVLSSAVIIRIKKIFKLLMRNRSQHRRLCGDNFKSIIVIFMVAISVLKLFSSNADVANTYSLINSEDITNTKRPINIADLRG